MIIMAPAIISKTISHGQEKNHHHCYYYDIVIIITIVITIFHVS